MNRFLSTGAHTGWGKRSFTIVRTENCTIFNNTRKNSVSRTHNCKPAFAPPGTVPGNTQPGNSLGRRLHAHSVEGREKRKRPVSLEGSKNQARAPSTGAGDAAPDGAAAPRAAAWVAMETGRGVTGSLLSCPSPEMHAGASLWSRMLRLLEGSRARVGLEPEPATARLQSGSPELCRRELVSGARDSQGREREGAGPLGALAQFGEVSLRS